MQFHGRMQRHSGQHCRIPACDRSGTRSLSIVLGMPIKADRTFDLRRIAGKLADGVHRVVAADVKRNSRCPAVPVFKEDAVEAVGEVLRGLKRQEPAYAAGVGRRSSRSSSESVSEGSYKNPRESPSIPFIIP